MVHVYRFPPLKRNEDYQVKSQVERLVEEIALAINYLRHQLDLKETIISETLDLANALHILGAEMLEAEHIKRTINLLLKDKEDIDLFFEERDLEFARKYQKKIGKRANNCRTILKIIFARFVHILGHLGINISILETLTAIRL